LLGFFYEEEKTLFDYTEKVVIITGAASGIGFAQAEAFLNKGAKVVGMDIHKNAMIDLQKNIEETFEFVIGSVRQKTDVQSLVHQAVERFEKIDILLNTAGVLDNYRKTLKTDEADRKSTRLNSSDVSISYAVFCLKKKNKKNNN